MSLVIPLVLIVLFCCSLNIRASEFFVSETDTFPIIEIDTTEFADPVDYTGRMVKKADSLNSLNSVKEFEKQMKSTDKRLKRNGKSDADSRSTPFIVRGELLSSHVDDKTKKKRKKLWKEIDPGDEIRRQLENSRSLLAKYNKNLKIAESIQNERLVEAMQAKIEYTKRLIKQQRKALKRIK